MEQKPTATKVATKWSLIYILTAIVVTYIFEIAKLEPNSPAKYLGFIPFIVFLFLAQKEFKDQLGGYISFGDAFAAGFRYALFSSILFAIFLYLYLTILSPEVFTKTLEAQRDGMAAKGLSSEQVDKAMDITKKYGVLIGAVFTVIIDVVVGAILALIGAAIFKKERTAFDPEPEAIDPTV